MLQFERIKAMIDTPQSDPLTSMHQLAVKVSQSVDQLLGTESIGRASDNDAELHIHLKLCLERALEMTVYDGVPAVRSRKLTARLSLTTNLC
jgi:hypothetical protein